MLARNTSSLIRFCSSSRKLRGRTQTLIHLFITSWLSFTSSLSFTSHRIEIVWYLKHTGSVRTATMSPYSKTYTTLFRKLKMGSKLARDAHTYLALTSLISFTLEKIAECCVLFITFSPSGLFGSIFGSSMNTSVNVARLRCYVASDVITSKMACKF